jgi:cytoplasmic iron level regulating protein YaaA (DUF328/UPF0246 family)
MLVILPPSETKVSGGREGTKLDLVGLSYPSQRAFRQTLLSELRKLSAEPEQAKKALKLGPKGESDIERNQVVASSPVVPALERYTGVLYDALGYSTLESSKRAWVDRHVGVFSALFGLIRAADLIPAYRLSFDSSLASGTPGKSWALARESLWAEVPGFVLDLRSEGYRALSPVPAGRGVFVALVRPGPLGSRKALGHTNKATKGALVKRLADTGAVLETVAELVAWGAKEGYEFDPASHHEGRIDLVISGS